jgi:hypothetical protein
MEREFKAHLLPTDNGHGHGLERALAPLEMMRDMAGETPDLLRAFFVLCFESVGPVPQLAPWMRAWLADYRTHVTTALRDGQHDGSVRTELDPSTEAHDVIVYGAGLGFCWTLEPDNVNFATALNDWMTQLHTRWTA